MILALTQYRQPTQRAVTSWTNVGMLVFFLERHWQTTLTQRHFAHRPYLITNSEFLHLIPTADSNSMLIKLKSLFLERFHLNMNKYKFVIKGFPKNINGNLINKSSI